MIQVIQIIKFLYSDLNLKNNLIIQNPKHIVILYYSFTNTIFKVKCDSNIRIQNKSYFYSS